METIEVYISVKMQQPFLDLSAAAKLFHVAAGVDLEVARVMTTSTSMAWGPSRLYSGIFNTVAGS